MQPFSPADLPHYPNVDPFNYETMKTALLERLESFSAAPFTVQRICELLTDPRKQYSRIDKFMRAIEKNILVVSTTEPGRPKSLADSSDYSDSLDSMVNGSSNATGGALGDDLAGDIDVDIELENGTSSAAGGSEADVPPKTAVLPSINTLNSSIMAANQTPTTSEDLHHHHHNPLAEEDEEDDDDDEDVVHNHLTTDPAEEAVEEAAPAAVLATTTTGATESSTAVVEEAKQEEGDKSPGKKRPEEDTEEAEGAKRVKLAEETTPEAATEATEDEEEKKPNDKEEVPSEAATTAEETKTTEQQAGDTCDKEGKDLAPIPQEAKEVAGNEQGDSVPSDTGAAVAALEPESPVEGGDKGAAPIELGEQPGKSSTVFTSWTFGNPALQFQRK